MYQVDIAGLFTGALSYRRLWVLLQGLPPESAFQTALANDRPEDADPPASEDEDADEAFGPWSHLELLIARLIDEVAFSRHQHLMEITAGKSKDKPPPPVHRPGVSRKRRRTALPTGAALQYLEAMRAEHRRLTQQGGDDG